MADNLLIVYGVGVLTIPLLLGAWWLANLAWYKVKHNELVYLMWWLSNREYRRFELSEERNAVAITFKHWPKAALVLSYRPWSNAERMDRAQARKQAADRRAAIKPITREKSDV